MCSIPPHACCFAHADMGAFTKLIQDYQGKSKIQYTFYCGATITSGLEKLFSYYIYGKKPHQGGGAMRKITKFRN
jgi:hypothetical protein